MQSTRSAFLLLPLLIITSCGDSPSRPTPTPTPTPEAPRAEITVGQVTPSSGATLVFSPCGTARLCTDQIETAFDILVATDVPEATVIVSLYRGGLPCAAAYALTSLTGGNRASFKTASMELIYDEEGVALCPVPTETTRLTFAVFSRNVPAVPVLTHELSNRYTLATQ